MSKGVFISHAVWDHEIASEIVTLIEEGIGVPETEIFCSSLKGYGISAGQNFVAAIKGQLLDPKVVVVLLTPAYLESRFCLSELGAAWIKSHAIFPILVPPLDYEHVRDVLLGTQVTKLDDDVGYNELLETLHGQLDCNVKSRTKWDTKRRAFLNAVKLLLPKVDGFSHVSSADHAKVVSELSEARAELDQYEQELRRTRQHLAELEGLKDRTDVEAVRARFAVADDGEDVSEVFDALVADIKGYKSTLRGRAVMMFALSDFYNCPYTINMSDDREEFEVAARYRFVDLEDGARVNWSNATMRTLQAKLKELGQLVAENGMASTDGDGASSLDPSAQDFWEAHYGL